LARYFKAIYAFIRPFKNFLYNGSGFFLDYQFVAIIGVFFIPIWGKPAYISSIFDILLMHRPHFAPDV
jgi:hypothetical protein